MTDEEWRTKYRKSGKKEEFWKFFQKPFGCPVFGTQFVRIIEKADDEWSFDAPEYNDSSGLHEKIVREG